MKKIAFLAAGTMALSVATAAYAFDEYGLYNEVYYADSGYTSYVGMRPGHCGNGEVVLGTLVGTETSYAVQEYVGLCINGSPFYY